MSESYVMAVSFFFFNNELALYFKHECGFFFLAFKKMYSSIMYNLL